MPAFCLVAHAAPRSRRWVLQSGDSFTWRGCAHCDRAQRVCTPARGLPTASIVAFEHVVGPARSEANGTGLAVRRRRPTQTLRAALARFESACSAGQQQTSIPKPAVQGGGQRAGPAVPACAEQISCARTGRVGSVRPGRDTHRTCMARQCCSRGATCARQHLCMQQPCRDAELHSTTGGGTHAR